MSRRETTTNQHPHQHQHTHEHPLHYSLLPAEAGFDAKRVGLQIIIPLECTSASYLDSDGKAAIVYGDSKGIKAALRAAGYRV